VSRSLRNLLLLSAVLVVLAAACGSSSSGPPADLVAARDTILVYPLAEPRGTGHAPPGFYEISHPEDFAADATYFVPTADIRDTILAWFKENLPAQGWTVEDPTVPSKDEQMASYCSSPAYASCASFVRGDVRAIIGAPLTLSFNAVERLGTPYHVHLEHK
jgi:hypothetical protein